MSSINQDIPFRFDFILLPTARNAPKRFQTCFHGWNCYSKTCRFNHPYGRKIEAMKYRPQVFQFIQQNMIY
jgi:hypothetical protein